jgi:hypothetical protein
VKINNFVPWRPVLKQLPLLRSKKLAAEIDPNQKSGSRGAELSAALSSVAARGEYALARVRFIAP